LLGLAVAGVIAMLVEGQKTVDKRRCAMDFQVRADSFQAGENWLAGRP